MVLDPTGGPNTYIGGTTITAGTLALGTAGAGGSGAITFGAGSQATLQVDGTVMPVNTLDAFAVGDTINLAGIAYSASGTAALLPGNRLDVTEGNHTYQLQLNPGDSFAGDAFALAAAASTGTTSTDVTLSGPPPCFCAGTRILTARGEVAVEALQVGDLAVTLGAGAVLKPVRWLGRTTVDLRRYARPDQARPIRIRAGALADGRPSRDLLVSPGHRFPIGGVLVAASDLVNGASIVREAPDQVEYWHVELDAHTILLADGVEAESYLDTGNRHAFEPGAVVALHPALALDAEGPNPCLPYGEVSQQLRRRLIVRAQDLGWQLDRDPAPFLEAAGVRIEPVRDGNRYRFALPTGAIQARLRSRANRPADTLPGSTDHRRLGLSLVRLALHAGEAVIEVPLNDPRLQDGFWQVEQGEGDACWRWTDGCALLPLAGTAATAIEVTIQQRLRFWVEPSMVESASPLREHHALAG